jgi:hypothetical protein
MFQIVLAQCDFQWPGAQICGTRDKIMILVRFEIWRLVFICLFICYVCSFTLKDGKKMEKLQAVGLLLDSQGPNEIPCGRGLSSE